MRFAARPLATAAAALAVTVGLVIPGSTASGASAAPVQGYLQKVLNHATAASVLTVMVHANDIKTAKSAVSASDLTLVTTFDKIGVAVAKGTASQVTKAATEPGVTYLEGSQPISFLDETANIATRSSQARDSLTGANGTKLDGTGVSVAVIDSGVDPTHPYFAEPDGGTAVVRSLKSTCADESSTSTDCMVDLPLNVDTDTLSGGGHGTHVNGIVAGRDITLTDGTKLHGAAPGAKLVSISTGAVLVIIGADAALNWVLENHAHPCVQHNQRYVDGGTAHRGHHRAAVPGQPQRDPCSGGGRDEVNRVQVHERRRLHRGRPVHVLAGQGRRPGRCGRGGPGAGRFLTS